MAGPNLPTRLGHALKAARMAFSGGWTWNSWRWGYSGSYTSNSLGFGVYGGSAYDYESAAGDLRLNGVVAACIACIQRAIREPRLTVLRMEGDQEEEVKDHQALRLLRRPNPHYSGTRLLQELVTDVLFGNGYWLKIGDRGGQVRELWPLPASDVRVETDTATVTYEYISRYVYTIGGQEFPYKPAEVVHFRHGFGDAKSRTAWGPVNAGKREVAALNEGANYRGAILRNMGVPSHILSPTEKMWDRQDFEMTEDLSKRLKELWAALTKGDNRGGILIPTFSAMLEKAGYSPQELDIAEMMKWDVDIICALLGVPAMLIDLPSGEDHRSYANKREAREFFTEQTLVPLLDGIADDLTLHCPELLDSERERFAFNYDDVRALQEDENAKYERIVKVREQSILTVDECRTELGFEAMTDEQKQELQPPPPPELGGAPESNGDRSAARLNGSTPPPVLMNGNGKAAAVKAVATVEQDGVAYRYSPEAPGEVAKEEFWEVDAFFAERAQRWSKELEGEDEPAG